MSPTVEQPYTLRMESFYVGLLLTLAVATTAASAERSRFRGLNGSALSEATRVPGEFGPDKNLRCRVPLPQGHSSLILFGNRVYRTGMRADETLVTSAVDRSTGKISWEREAPKVRTKVVDKRNNPA